jgi:hypothetical protein
MIVTLHELEDFQGAKENKRYPGAEVIKRRWDRRTAKAATDGWFILAPVATRAFFVEDGRLKPERVTVPMREVWQRYHVDFDRFVLEGGSDAMLIAASQPNFYAGLIVRGDKADLPTPDLARNLATLAVYVVGTPESAAAKTLAAGGFPTERLTVGGPEGLTDWLATVKRTVPRSFRWSVQDPEAQQLAQWMNLEAVEGKTPSLSVESIDTEDDPNSILVSSDGVRSVTIFLSDRVIDLDRPVRVVVNGHAIVDAGVPSNSPKPRAVKLPARLDRSLDLMFDPAQFSIRKSMYYGWLYPTALQQIVIRTDASREAACPVPPGGGTTPQDPASKARAEENAQRYFTKAEEKEKAGDIGRALDLYRKAVAAGDSSVRVKAEAKVKELEAKAADPSKPAGADKPGGGAAK